MTTAVKQSEIAGLQKEIATITGPFIPRIKVLKIVDVDSLAQADGFLTRIHEARKLIESKIKKVLDPLNEARNELLGLKREMDNPLAQLEEQLRDGMKQYRLEEARKAREEEEARRKEAERIEREARQKALAAEAAKSQSMKTRLTNQAQELEAKAVEVVSAPVSSPTVLMGSGTRTVRKVSITDRKALLKSILSGEVPDDIITFDMGVLERYRRMDEETVKSWKGISIVEDIEIVRRGR